ncbi:SDR family NAD(P)-dependent oxidoreductase [Luteimonas aquatica]|uniref:SDR family NAD(P)-dependent oxidoreductase n=1 Tax=Luteimonas aquatica TaxID=450364 RepID=UPI001F5684F0|nr:SDR family oxidoreductase [Luteimonas aquatica]
MKRFDGRVAAITGAGSGIGRALALDLAARGCHLALSDIQADGLAQTAQRAAQARPGLKITTATLDVSRREAVFAWAEQVAREHGKVNLVFNNAGVALSATVEGMTYDDFEWLFGINFWGVVHGTKAFLPHLKASGEGHVVNISSVFGLAGIPGQSAYNASKFAVRGFTEALRQELDLAGLPVGATCVHPGGIKTNIARAARTSASIRDIGMDERDRGEKAEKLFITTPEAAARTILQGVERNRRRVLIGRDARLLDRIVRLFPTSYHLVTTRIIRRAMAPR